MSGETLLWIGVLGGFAGMDVVAFPQVMISRPIVAATLAGAAAGNMLAGLLAGAALEMLAMELLPVGAARYPEWGSASVAGGAVAASPAARAAPAAAILIGVLTALAAAWAGGWTMHGLRRLNGQWSVRARARIDAGESGLIARLQWRGLTGDFLRAALLAIGAAGLAGLVSPAALVRIGLDAWWLIAITAALAVAVAGSSAWRFSSGAPRARWLAVIAFLVVGAFAAGAFR